MTEKSEDLSTSIETFKELLKTEPDLNVRTDDNFILRHLRATNGDATKAFEKLKTYYELKRDYPEWFATEPPEEFKEFLETGIDIILEDRDATGKRIWICKLGKMNPTEMTPMYLSRLHDVFADTLLDEDETQRNGIALILDFKDISWSILKWFIPSNVKVGAKKADVQPLPTLDYHIVNTSRLFNIILKMTYPFLSAKQRECLFIHGNKWASLHEKLDPALLPEEYGGVKPYTSTDVFYQQYLENLDNLKVNLSLGYRVTNMEERT